MIYCNYFLICECWSLKALGVGIVVGCGIGANISLSGSLLFVRQESLYGMAHEQNSVHSWNVSVIWENICKYFMLTAGGVLSWVLLSSQLLMQWTEITCSVFSERSFMTNGRIIALANLYWGIHTAGLVGITATNCESCAKWKNPCFFCTRIEYKRSCCLLCILGTGAPALAFLF